MTWKVQCHHPWSHGEQQYRSRARNWWHLQPRYFHSDHKFVTFRSDRSTEYHTSVTPYILRITLLLSGCDEVSISICWNTEGVIQAGNIGKMAGKHTDGIPCLIDSRQWRTRPRVSTTFRFYISAMYQYSSLVVVTITHRAVHWVLLPSVSRELQRKKVAERRAESQTIEKALVFVSLPQATIVGLLLSWKSRQNMNKRRNASALGSADKRNSPFPSQWLWFRFIQVHQMTCGMIVVDSTRKQSLSKTLHWPGASRSGSLATRSNPHWGTYVSRNSKCWFLQRINFSIHHTSP